ncbi:hypothetical protein RZS08_15495, partial [Arthrospira platensis SPKY1]|nr:hypothetical protein [Arthrospira platensis SPKY1]
EVIDKYQANPLLHGMVPSDKVVLNLKLEEDSKNIWINQLMAAKGVSVEPRYEGHGQLFNLGKTTKSYIQASSHNLHQGGLFGFQTYAINGSLTMSQPLDPRFSVEPVASLVGGGSGFEARRTVFADNHGVSFTRIHNPSKRLKSRWNLMGSLEQNKQFDLQQER